MPHNEFKLLRWKEMYLPDLAKMCAESLALCASPSVQPAPLTPESARTFINARLCADEQRELCRAIVIEGAAVGGIEIFRAEGIYGCAAYVTFWLSEVWRSRHIMSAALSQISAEAFDSLGVVRLTAIPFSDNIPARKALNNAGFSLDGTLRGYALCGSTLHDGCIYSLLSQ